MDREYDIFEKLPDGSLIWHAFAMGLESAVGILKQLGSISPNEHFAMHTPSKEIVARVNTPESGAAESV